MKKEHIIKAAIELIDEYRQAYGLTVVDKGTGHAFDNSFWKGLTDDSEIPEITAYNDDFNIKLRSFWGCPEIDVTRKKGLESELLVLNYADSFHRVKAPTDSINNDDINTLLEKGVLNLEITENDLSLKPFSEKYTKSLYFKGRLIGTLEDDKNDNHVNIIDDYKIRKTINNDSELKEKLILGNNLIEYDHSNDFKVHEVRCDSINNYQACLKDIQFMIDFIEDKVKEYEMEEQNLNNDVER